MSSCTEAASAMYSASHDDSATVGCFLDFHEMGGRVLNKLKQ